MNEQQFPYVKLELVEALEKAFPITLRTLSQPHEKILIEQGRQELIDWLRTVYEAQSNSDKTE